MKDTKTTNTLLLIIVVPIVFYLLKILSFIFIPLILSMFIALLFLPLMRWLNKKNVPKPAGIGIIVLIVVAVLKLGAILIKLSSNEITSADSMFFEKAQTKLLDLVVSLESFFGIERLENDPVLLHYFQNKINIDSFGSTLDFLGDILSMTMMTAFFVVLLLSESINFQKLLNNTLFRVKYSSVKTFMKIEKDIIKFVKVKFIISFFTGLGFTIACYFFDISFPIFWGLIAFVLNFVQLIGSIASVVLLAAFAFIDIELGATLFFFILTITAIEVVLGGIIEPIYMGKTFSVNIITVLVMLMLWGYIWGIPGLIMSIPITVFIKIILEQFPNTRIIANLMDGSDMKVNLPWQKK